MRFGLHPPHHLYRILVTGALLLIGFGILSALSSRFLYSLPIMSKPIGMIVILLIIMGLIYLSFTLDILKKARYSFSFSNSLRAIFLLGFIFRLMLFSSNPILEDDFNRYLWDGAIFANGYNPYKFSPSEIRANTPNIPLALPTLSKEAGKIFDHINHPHIKTIYPPIAIFFFSIAYKISPWNINAWWGILLIMDFLTLFLLIIALKKARKPMAYIALYWLNPLLIVVTYNALHMDLLLFPFLLAFILLSVGGHGALSGVLLALAVNIKIWPVVFLPMVLRAYLTEYQGQFKKIIMPIVGFTITMAITFIPQYISSLSKTSGLIVYAQSWENNSSLFRMFLFIFETILPWFQIHPGYGQALSRYLVTGILIIWSILVILPPPTAMDKKIHWYFQKGLLITAALFILSPTQFPWYFTWILPFLTITPSRALLCFTVLLPLYYTRYYLEPRQLMTFFNYGVVWMESLPVLLLLGLELYLFKKKQC